MSCAVGRGSCAVGRGPATDGRVSASDSCKTWVPWSLAFRVSDWKGGSYVVEYLLYIVSSVRILIFFNYKLMVISSDTPLHADSLCRDCQLSSNLLRHLRPSQRYS